MPFLPPLSPPLQPINTSLYLCDNKFHTEALADLLQDESRFGFIVMDGMGTLYGTVQGNVKDVLHKFSVDLPKKHGRGGQSSVRFARLRVEKRHVYMAKVAELAKSLFIPSGQVPSIKGLVLAGAAELKNELVTSGLMDQRLVTIILKSVDTSYGGENGFNQAIALSADALASVKFTEERVLIQHFFDEITMDSGKYAFGVKDTFSALEASAVETLVVWEDLETQRYELRHPVTSAVRILHLGKDAEKEKAAFVDAETGVEYEVVDKTPLVDWFAAHYKEFGAKLEFVTNKSQEGAQFVRGEWGVWVVRSRRVSCCRLVYRVCNPHTHSSPPCSPPFLPPPPSLHLPRLRRHRRHPAVEGGLSGPGGRGGRRQHPCNPDGRRRGRRRGRGGQRRRRRRR